MRSTNCVDNMPESGRMALKDSFVYLRATMHCANHMFRYFRLQRL
jgi:hypothetical protein